MTDQELEEQAAQEYRDNVMDTGLWARAMSEVDGDEERARQNYIALRVAQLEREQRGEDPHGQAGEDAEAEPPAREGVGARAALYGLVGVVIAVVIVVSLLFVL